MKSKNEELLKRSILRSETGQNNINDIASQSSRLTNELEALEIDTTSNASGYGRKKSPPHVSGSVLYNPFTKNIQNGSTNNMNGHYGNGYIIVQQPDFVQPCFACGCTCRGINKFHWLYIYGLFHYLIWVKYRLSTNDHSLSGSSRSKNFGMIFATIS